MDGRDGRALRLTLKDQAIADAALPDRSEAYRHLDTGVLETLLLKSALGLSDEDISHFNGLFYARDTAEALAMVRSGEYDAAFLMRPTPVEQVRDVAAAGENMPPKSTYFLPQAAHRSAVQSAHVSRPGQYMWVERSTGGERDRHDPGIGRADKDESHRATRRRAPSGTRCRCANTS